MKLLIALLLLSGSVRGQKSLFLLNNSTSDTLIVKMMVYENHHADSIVGYIYPSKIWKAYGYSTQLYSKTISVRQKNGKGYWSIPEEMSIELKSLWFEVNFYESPTGEFKQQIRITD